MTEEHNVEWITIERGEQSVRKMERGIPEAVKDNKNYERKSHKYNVCLSCGDERTFYLITPPQESVAGVESL